MIRDPKGFTRVQLAVGTMVLGILTVLVAPSDQASSGNHGPLEP